MNVEHENCDYHDYEWDHTPEEVASDLLPGYGSNTYSDEELDAVEAYEYGPTKAEEGFTMDRKLSPWSDPKHDIEGDIRDVFQKSFEIGLGPPVTVEEFESFTAPPPRPPEDRKPRPLGFHDAPEGQDWKVTSSVGPSGAGPTDCMNCGGEDGRTRAHALHCHDCMEDLSCL